MPYNAMVCLELSPLEDSAGWCDMSKSNISQCDCVAADCSFAGFWHVLAPGPPYGLLSKVVCSCSLGEILTLIMELPSLTPGHRLFVRHCFWAHRCGLWLSR